MDEVIKYFLIESHEETDRIDSNLLALETDPQNLEIINTLFRGFHSIKGTCGFLGFSILEKVTHSAENILSQLRDGKKTSNPKIISLLLESNTITKNILAFIEESDGTSEGSEDYQSFIQSLKGVLDASDTIIPTQSPVLNPKQEEKSVEKIAENIKSDVMDSTIRVDVKVLDKLVNLVGELVLNRNQIMTITDRLKDPQLVLAAQKLNSLTGEVQEGIMRTRMQPIKSAWDKFPRMVRDLSTQLNKKISIEFYGEDTELDKSIIESIRDPLTHLIRNSIDHGIESPEERIEKGKPPEGKIVLRAYTEGGLVHIHISDDGKGLNPEKIKAKAISKGLVTREQISSWTESEVLQLIFLPGFSTADQVTNISGRGVGMDVVKSNLQKIGGNFVIQNSLGVGLEFRITIPLTLTILPSLLVRCGDFRFAIPQLSLREVVELDSDHSQIGFETIHGSLVYNLRGKLLTVTKLHELLGIKSYIYKKGENDIETTIVILGDESWRFGLIVDEVLDTEEVVVKPLGKHIQNIFCYSGVTILGDGEIAFILNIQGIGEKLKTKVIKEKVIPAQKMIEKTSYVVFELKGKYKLGLPLENISRIEEVQLSDLRISAGKRVISHRGKLVPVVDLCHLLLKNELYDSSTLDFIKVLIYQKDSISIGLIVDKIIDIYEDEFIIREKEGNWKDLPIEADSIGSIQIGKELIDILDINSVSNKFKNLLQREMIAEV